MADATAQRKLDEELWNYCEQGELEKAKTARAAGGSPKWVHPLKPEGRGYQFTALHIATDRGHTDIVKWLAEKGGADLNQKCAYGETALQHIDGTGKHDDIRSYLKMKTAMAAVLAAQRFKEKRSTKAED